MNHEEFPGTKAFPLSPRQRLCQGTPSHNVVPCIKNPRAAPYRFLLAKISARSDTLENWKDSRKDAWKHEWKHVKRDFWEGM